MAEPGIKIVEPPDGSEFLSGDQIFIDVESIDGFTLDQVLITTTFANQTLTSSPFTLHLTIPDEVIGAVKIMAIGRDSLMQFVSDEIVVNILPSATLESLQAGIQKVQIIDQTVVEEYIGHHFQGKNGVERILVKGKYSDGMTRRLDSSSLGTTYLSNDPGIVTVDEEGRLDAQGVGETTVTVTHSGVIVEVPVTVSNTPPELTFIGDKQINGNETLSFVLEANDKEGDSLAFSASNLPEGADFDPETQRFAWTPSDQQAGVYPGVLFSVTDGIDSVSENITITVLDVTAGVEIESPEPDTTIDTPSVTFEWTDRSDVV